MDSISSGKVMYTALAVSEKQAAIKEKTESASRRKKRNRSRHLYDEDEGIEDVEELARFNPWEALWKGWVFFNSLATIGTNIFSMVAFESPIHEAAAIVATLVATATAYREITMDSIIYARKAFHFLRAKVNTLAHEHIRLYEKLETVEHRVFCLKEEEARLKALAGQRDFNINKLVGLVAKKRRIQFEMRKLLIQDVIADVVSIVFETDKDGSGNFTENEIKTMINRIKKISNISVNEELLRAALEKNNSAFSVLDLVIDLSRDDTSFENRIFSLDWDDRKLRTLIGEKPKLFSKTAQEKIKHQKDIWGERTARTRNVPGAHQDVFYMDTDSAANQVLFSPLHQYPDNNGISCWSPPSNDGIFKVRGKDYFKNRSKVPSGPASFTCRGVDMWLTNNPVYHIARHPDMLGGKLHDNKGYDTFLVNFLLSFGNFVCYFRVPPVEEMPDKVALAWAKFVQGDDEYRNARLKVLPNVLEGPWIVKATVGNGTNPKILGKGLPVKYFFQEAKKKGSAGGVGVSGVRVKSGGYYEVDVNIRASNMANGILNVVKDHTKSLTMAFAFILQANQAEELPETVLCSVQIHSLDLELCSHLPEYDLDNMPVDFSLKGLSSANEETEFTVDDRKVGDSSIRNTALLSPLPQYPDNNGKSCWSVPIDDGIFKVRGQDYFKNRSKVASSPASFTCRGVDMWLTNNPVYHIARHPDMLGGKLHDNKGYDTFLVNFLLSFGNFVCYFRVPPVEEMPDKVALAWTKFVQGDDEYRNARLKVLPNVLEGPWIVKATVGNGTNPKILGKGLPVKYFFQDATKKGSDGGVGVSGVRVNSGGYYEVDVNIRASNMANGILNVVKDHTKSLTMAFAFILQANQAEELPETVLCSVQIHSLDLELCSHLPEYDLDNMPVDFSLKGLSSADEETEFTVDDRKVGDSSIPTTALLSPLPQYPDNNGKSCWSVPIDDGIFKVRGKDYFKNRSKVASSPASFTCRGVDMWLTNNPVYHIARHPDMLGGKLHDNKGYDTFLVNFLLSFGNFVCYFRVPPVEEMPDKVALAWTKFVQGDDEYRNARLKVLPNVLEGPWIVKATVGNGTNPKILGKGLPVKYFFQDATKKSGIAASGGVGVCGVRVNSGGYYEVDVNIRASNMANGILNVVKDHTKSLTMAFAFILQANQAEELPETVLCSVQIHSLDLELCSHLPEYDLDNMSVGFSLKGLSSANEETEFTVDDRKVGDSSIRNTALLSPLPQYPDNNGKSCWSIPDNIGIFKVRGQDYFKNRSKVASSPSPFTCCGVDMWLTNNPIYHIGRHPNMLGGELLNDKKDQDTFLVNFLLPFGNFVCYFRIPPNDEISKKIGSAWTRFAQGDDQYRNDRLEILPMIIDGPWIVMTTLGNSSTPILVSEYVPPRYFFPDRSKGNSGSGGGGFGGSSTSTTGFKSAMYYEVDIDIRSSAFATGVLSILKDHAKSLTTAFAIIIQGKEAKELPETVLCSVQTHFLDLDVCSQLPEHNLDDISF